MMTRIDAAGVEVASAESSGRCTWRGVFAVKKGALGAYFYISPASAYVAPRSAFESQSAFDAFAAQAEAYWRAAREEADTKAGS
jgi:hypothetical protein